MKNEPTDFTKNVIKTIKSIPRGKVATYGLIAKIAGKPQGPRGVGWQTLFSRDDNGISPSKKIARTRRCKFYQWKSRSEETSLEQSRERKNRAL